MPVYEYKCEKTGKIYEINQSINDAPLTKCFNPNCECKNTSLTHRIISKNIGLIFNGKGFYKTDYVKENNSAPAPSSQCSCSANCPHAH